MFTNFIKDFGHRVEMKAVVQKVSILIVLLSTV